MNKAGDTSERRATSGNGLSAFTALTLLGSCLLLGACVGDITDFDSSDSDSDELDLFCPEVITNNGPVSAHAPPAPFPDIASAAQTDNSGRDASSDSGNTSTISPRADNCSIEARKVWVYDAMRDYYLFADQVPDSIDLAQYADEQELIEALRVEPYDRFSYITDASTYEAQFEKGEIWGYGWQTSAQGEDILFAYIDPGSPADTAGLERGDKLASLNGYTVAEYRELPVETRKAIFGENGTPTTVTIGYIRGGAATVEVDVTSGSYLLETVTDTRVIERGNHKIGYFNYLQFNNPSRTALADAIEELETAGVNELVVDLRFNPGGRATVASEFGARIGACKVMGQEFGTIAFNERYDDQDLTWDFPGHAIKLELDRVYFLVSDDSCSASEMLIESLKPYMDVVVVGDTTCGKPYGTMARERCGKALNLVETVWSNASGEGDYYEGLAPDCPALDDTSIALGADDEVLLSNALAHIESGSCSTPNAAGESRLAARMGSAATSNEDWTDPALVELASQLNDGARGLRF